MATVFSVPAAAENPSIEDLIRMNQELMQRNQALMQQNEALMQQNNVLIDEVKTNSARIQDLEVYQQTPPPGGVVAAGYAPSGIGQAPNGQTPQSGAQPAAAHQGAQPEEDLFLKRGHFPGSYQIPGTEGATSDGKGFAFKVGGYTKLDIINSFRDHGTNAEDLFDVTAIPTRTEQLADADRVNIHARESRLNFDVRGETKIGMVRGFVEGDFFGGGGNETLSNSRPFRLRHAFVQMGNALAGQTWSTYSNPTAYAERLDFQTQGAQTFIRQAMFRWTQPLDMIDPNASIAFAAENPESLVLENGVTETTKNEMPEFVLRGKYSGNFGVLQASTVLRNIPADSEDEDIFGYGVHLSGKLFIPWLKQGGQQDDFRFEMNYGDGIGRYMIDVAGSGGLGGLAGGAAQVNPSNGELETITAFGGYGSFRHFWLETVRSNFMGSYVEVQNEDFRPDNQLNKTIMGGANLIWSPIPAVDVGGEFLYGFREDADGQFGELTRVMFSSKYKF